MKKLTILGFLLGIGLCLPAGIMVGAQTIVYITNILESLVDTYGLNTLAMTGMFILGFIIMMVVIEIEMRTDENGN